MDKKNLRGRIRLQDVAKGFVKSSWRNKWMSYSNARFDFEPGMLNVIMGSSGCGKSTLAYLLAGYLKADSGLMEVDSKPISHPGSDRIMVFQETALWPWMTVY